MQSWHFKHVWPLCDIFSQTKTQKNDRIIACGKCPDQLHLFFWLIKFPNFFQILKLISFVCRLFLVCSCKFHHSLFLLHVILRLESVLYLLLDNIACWKSVRTHLQIYIQFTNQLILKIKEKIKRGLMIWDFTWSSPY